MISLMRLDRFWLEEMILETALEDNSETDEYTYDIKEIDFDVKKNRQSSALRVRLLVEIIADENPRIYGVKRLRVALWGQFSFAENAEEDFIQQVTPENQLAILYGLARGLVANLTGATAAGTFLLPSVDFHAITAEKVRRMQQKASLAPAEVETTLHLQSLKSAGNFRRQRRNIGKSNQFAISVEAENIVQ